MNSIINFLYKCINGFSSLIIHSAMWGVFSLMMIVVIDILMRSIARRSILITEEMGGYLLVLIAYLGMAETLKQGRHVKVDFLSKKFPESFRKWLHAILSFLAMIALSVVTWRVVIMVYRSYESKATVPGVFLTPVYIPQSLLIIGLIALLLQHIISFVKIAVNIKEKKVLLK